MRMRMNDDVEWIDIRCELRIDWCKLKRLRRVNKVWGAILSCLLRGEWKKIIQSIRSLTNSITRSCMRQAVDNNAAITHVVHQPFYQRSQWFPSYHPHQANQEKRQYARRQVGSSREYPSVLHATYRSHQVVWLIRIWHVTIRETLDFLWNWCPWLAEF